MKTTWLLFLVALFVLQTVSAQAVNESLSTRSVFSKPQAAVTADPAKPIGTHMFLSKQAMRKKLVEQQTDFPYDIKESIAWIRANKISVMDPTTKKTLLVNIMSDAQIKAFLLKPLGRRWSGIDDAGLKASKSSTSIVDEHLNKGYSVSSYRKDLEKNMSGAGQSGKKELPYFMLRTQTSVEPPQAGNLNEEYTWIRANIQTVYDPFKKQTVAVARMSQEYMKFLLKAPAVRKSIGLPASAEKFEKSARFS